VESAIDAMTFTNAPELGEQAVAFCPTWPIGISPYGLDQLEGIDRK
jgi:hypothetical protein